MSCEWELELAEAITEWQRWLWNLPWSDRDHGWKPLDLDYEEGSIEWLYWCTPAKPRVIGPIFGLRDNQVSSTVDRPFFLHTCQCGEEFRVYFSSRSGFRDLTKLQRDGYSNLERARCSTCQEASQVSRRLFWKERSDREEELRRIPYYEYLQTPEWQERRKRKLKSASYRCQVCNREGQLDVHHRTYERRGREWDKDLTVLCRGCHARHHGVGE